VSRKLLAALLALSLGVGLRAAPSRADTVHIYARGETFAALAERYYGNASFEPIIVAANFLYLQASPAVPTGSHLTVPSVRYLRVEAGDTWSQLAQRHLGDARRGAYLARINGGRFDQSPSASTVIRLPYLLRYVVMSEEPLFEIARRFYGDRALVQFITEFNHLGSQRVSRGQVLVLPLADVVLRETSGAANDATLVAAHGAQRDVERDLPALRRLVQRGLYVEAVSLGGRLAGVPELTQSHRVAIHSALAEAHAALDRPDLAADAYRQVLAADPSFTLDPTVTPPKLLTAFALAHGTAPSVVLQPAPPTGRPDTAH